MKTITVSVDLYQFDELTQTAKDKAINDRINDMIEYESADHYENWPEFKKAVDTANRMQTPWFTGSYVWDYCKNEILADLRERDFTSMGDLY